MNLDGSSDCNSVPPPQVSETFETQYPVPATVLDEAAFRRREANAVSIGTVIGGFEKKVKVMWDELTPEIYPVWSHRSKRGDDHEKGRKEPGTEQETWTPWLRDFCARTGLHPKAVERHIMTYRVNVLGLRPQPSPSKKAERISAPVPASSGEQSSDTHSDADPVEAKVESHRASAGRVEFLHATAGEAKADDPDDQDNDYVMDESFAFYSRLDEDKKPEQLKAGDRSGLLQRIIQKCGPDFDAVLTDLSPAEQAHILDFLYKDITKSCCPAVRRGSDIKAWVEYTAPPLQARKGQPCVRVN